MASNNLISAVQHLQEASRTVDIIKATIERRYPPDAGLDVLIQALGLELQSAIRSLNKSDKEQQ